MNESVRPQFEPLHQWWENGGSDETVRTAVSFVILSVISFSVCLLFPDVGEFLFDLVNDLMSASVLSADPSTITAFDLFFNNGYVCFMIMFLGLIPFVRLPALHLGMNAMLLGVLAAYFVQQDMSLLLYFAALIPHGVLELPALILSIAMGLYLSGQMARRCRKDASALSLIGGCTLMMRLFTLMLVPLLLLAALVEAYITPLVISLFL